ncbi:MAG: NAD+ synthase [Phycisphaerales bacterium]|nr:NAD+ synthase [Phycisphaerales bacterium]
MRIAMAQLNPIVGDIAGNTQNILHAIARAKDQGAGLVIFSELAVIGYPPRDLLLKPVVLEQMAAAVDHISRQCVGITALVGFVEQNTAAVGRTLRNAAAFLRDGAIVAKGYKSLLPTYDVFDETRYFEPAPQLQIVPFENHKIGISICEDLWNDEQVVARQLYPVNPVARMAEAGADMLVNLSASPYVMGKNTFRRKLIAHQAQRWKLPVVYVNQVGANDELIFDGNSMAVDANGRMLAQAKDFQEDIVTFDLPARDTSQELLEPRQGMESLHAALVMGLRDYAEKCGFAKVVLGLSGGIDSAVVAAIAVEALGRESVLGVALPSRYSSEQSLIDARQLAAALAIKLDVIPIEEVHHAMEHTLEGLFKGTQPGLAEENIQARLRGNILMALSNKFGYLLLTTGNKSEIATGYCTLYGDMCGGLAVISDVPKTMVYPLAHEINRQWVKAGRQAPIPESSLKKAPSADLRPNQTDQDSLPPYSVLDAILERYVELEQSAQNIVAAGFDELTVRRVIQMVDSNEYKRKQMPPGLKVTSRAFGFGRRMPIAQRYRPLVIG